MRNSNSSWLSVVLPLVGLVGTVGTQVACIPVVSAPEYPKTWPALKETPSGTCAAISGTYSDQSLQGDPESEQMRLLEFLLGDIGLHGPCARPPETPEYRDCPTAVRLEQLDAETLVITALGEEGVLIRQGLSASRGNLECTSDGLKIAIPTSVDPTDGSGWSRVFLNQSADGSLVLRDVDKAMLAVTGVAILSYERRWYRFASVAASMQPALEAIGDRLHVYAPTEMDSPTESAVIRAAPRCLKRSCLARIVEMNQRTLVYNRRFDEHLGEIRLPPSRYRIDTHDLLDSSMEVELAQGLHYELHSEICQGSKLPVQCPFRTEKVLTWLEELESGSIVGGDTWWKEVTYRKHLSPMVADIPADEFWSANPESAREVRLTADICDGILIDRVVIKNKRVKIELNGEPGKAQAVKFSVTLFFYNRSDGRRLVTPRLEVVKGEQSVVVMEHEWEKVDQQGIKKVTLRSAPVPENAFLALLDDDPQPILRITVAVHGSEEEAALGR